ncbi:hypothetical protein [Gordonia malaquae]|uniref:hypothetical protein n=1 Tax=Gordonia malaquae TaxID=410332 RepID=UPI0030FE6279
MTYPSYPPQPKPNRLLPLLVVTAVVLAAALLVAIVVIVSDDDPNGNNTAATASTASTETAEQTPTAETTETTEPEQQAPVPGAYPGAGGPMPAGTVPLVPYVNKYTNDTSAHLLTPTGGVGCDFNRMNEDGEQGQCGVLSMNRVDSPLGAERIGGTTKGKWLFPLVRDHVQAPVGSSGTTGWMNAPSLGYTVPRAEYGKVYSFDQWACASETTGLTCWNTETGSGVFLSNEKAVAFDGPGTATTTGTRTTTGTVTADSSIVFGSVASNGQGLGTPKPATVFYGGSPTSLVEGITWSSWGDDRAEGTGTGNYVAPGRTTAQSVKRPATIVAFAPGTCHGRRAYTKAAIYFPGQGQTFSENRAVDICFTD